MISAELKNKLTEIGRAEFDKYAMFERYVEVKRYRTDCGAEDMMAIGTRILKNELSNGVFDNAGDKRSFDNVVNRDLLAKESRLIAHDINVRLHNPINTNPMSQDVLEAELNYAIDFHRLIRKTDGVISSKHYHGLGYVKSTWDKWYFAPGWETGKPDVRVCDSRKMYISNNAHEKYLEDNDIFFEVFTYSKKALIKKIRSGEFDNIGDTEKTISLIEGHREVNNLVTQQYGYGQDIDVVVCQYLDPHIFEMRALKDYVSDDEAIYEVFNDEIESVAGKDKLDKLEDIDDDEALPKGIRASKPYKRRVDSWYETIMIPSLDIVLKKPYCVGDESEYTIYAGRQNPDSSYPFADAYDLAQILEIHSIAMTMRVIGAIKLFKSIPWFDPDGIENGESFINNWEDWDEPLIIKPEWLEKNPGKLPFGWIKSPQGGIDLERLEAHMETRIDDNTRSTPALMGQSGGSHQSAKQTETLASNALNSSKTDFYPYELMLTNLCSKLKVLIAEYKDVPHKFNYMGEIITVNDVDSPVNLMDVAPHCMVVIKEADNDSYVEEQEEAKILELTTSGFLPFKYGISNSGLRNPEAIITEKAQQDQAFKFLQMVQELAQIDPTAFQIIQEEVQKQIAQGAQVENNDNAQPRQPQQQ